MSPRTRMPIALVAVALTLLTLGTWPSSAATTAARTDKATAAVGTSAVRIGTYNIRAGVSTSEFRSAVTEFADRVDIVGLQEVNSKEKQGVMYSMSGWRHYRPKRHFGEQNPVMWRMSEFEMVYQYSAMTSATCYIGDELPGKGGVIRAHYATVVKLRHRTTNQRIVVINAHLVPGAVKGGVPVPGRERLFACYARELKNLRALSVAEGVSAQVFTMGDFNAGFVADQRNRKKRLPLVRFEAVNMESMWATERPLGIGTHQDALIDQVFSTERAASASVVLDINYSDHRPAIGTYLLGG